MLYDGGGWTMSAAMRTNELEKGSGGDDEFGQYMYLHMLRKAQRGNSTWATFPWISVSFIIRSGGSSTTFSLKCRGRSVVRAAGDHRGPSHRWGERYTRGDRLCGGGGGECEYYGGGTVEGGWVGVE